MSSLSERATEKVPWALVVILSAFLGTFGIAWANFLPSVLFNYYSFGEVICTIGLVAAPFIILIFTALFSKLINRSVSLVTLTYLYAIGMTCSWFINPYQPTTWYDIIASRHVTPVESLAYVPWFMAPPEAITRQLLSGHVPIPWGEWLPSTLYHWTQSVLLSLFFIAIATLFRRLWIDTEKITFPHTLLAYELVKRFPEKRPLMQKLGKPFSLGIVLGLAYQIPIFMTVVFPWFPDIFGWKTICGAGNWYVRGGTPLAGIAGLTTVSVHPVAAAVGYVIPLSISFNVWFWYLVWLILMQASYVMGFYTGIENNGGCGRTGWCSPSGVIDPPLMMNSVTYGGGLLGITVMTLVLNRRYIRDTIKAAFAKHSSRLEIEKNEALTYRDTYVLLGASFILLLILFMASGLGFAAALLMIITYFLFWVAYARIYGLTGFATGGESHGSTLFRLLMWPTPPSPLTTEYVLSAHYSFRAMDEVSVIYGSIYSGFASYKMASITGTNNSGILKAMLAASVITPVAVILTTIWLCYTYGGTALPGNAGWGVNSNHFYGHLDPSMWVKLPTSEPMAPYVVVGFLIVVVLDYLHARLMWFPFNAVGFVIGMSRENIKWGWWGPFLIAWILKTITLRVGGSKLYEEVGVPIAGGFVAGYMIAIIFGGTMGVLKFFIPY